MSRFLVRTGIEEVKTAYRSPWQNPFVERYGGTLGRELLDHVIILNEEHLKRLLKEYIEEWIRKLSDSAFELDGCLGISLPQGFSGGQHR